MKKRALLALVLLAACGGKIDGDDGGTPGGNDGGTTGFDAIAKKDAIALPDVISPPPPECTPIQSSGTVSTNGCGVDATWSCGDTTYDVDCSCPSAQCACSMIGPHGGSGTTVQAPSVCPSCNGDLPTFCNFPH